MHNSFLGRIPNSKVVLSDGGLAGVKGGGVSGRPGSVTDGGVQVDSGVGSQVHVSVEHKTFVLVFGLKLA